MKLKLDENLGASVQSLFSAVGHDVETASSEGLRIISGNLDKS